MQLTGRGGCHVDSCVRQMASHLHGNGFSQAQILRLCPRSPWRVALSFFFFPSTMFLCLSSRSTPKFQCAARSLTHKHKHTHTHTRCPGWKQEGVSPWQLLFVQSALSSASERCEAAYFSRNPPVASKPIRREITAESAEITTVSSANVWSQSSWTFVQTAVFVN